MRWASSLKNTGAFLGPLFIIEIISWKTENLGTKSQILNNSKMLSKGDRAKVKTVLWTSHGKILHKNQKNNYFWNLRYFLGAYKCKLLNIKNITKVEIRNGNLTTKKNYIFKAPYFCVKIYKLREKINFLNFTRSWTALVLRKW